MKNKIKDEWLIAEGKHEGKRLIIRLNVGARSLAGDKRYSCRLGIAVPFKSPQADGMPGENKLQQLDQIEDMIDDHFNAEHRGVLCIILTTNGMREFVVYAATADTALVVKNLSRHFPAYDFQSHTEQDEDWDVYSYWAERLDK